MTKQWQGVSVVHFDDANIARIAGSYHAWRGDGAGEYADVPGFCKAAPLDEVRGHGHVLTPGRYVGAEEPDDEGTPFEEKLQMLMVTLGAQFSESAKLEAAIRRNLRDLANANA